MSLITELKVTDFASKAALVGILRSPGDLVSKYEKILLESMTRESESVVFRVPVIIEGN